MVKKKTEALRYTEAVGRRKTSVARVRIIHGGAPGISVNNKKIDDYFVTPELRHAVSGLFGALNFPQGLSVSARVKGGGIHSQSEALRHGIMRAMVKFEVSYRTPIKKLKLLTRDARVKERRKFGLKKARKAPQWSKR